MLSKVGTKSPDLEAALGKITSRTPANISWSSLDFRAGETMILNKVWGTVKSGEVCCIMGASGAGKSSLLNVIAGRSTTSGNVKVSGKITVNGKVIDPVAFRENVAYVMQDDALMATATPREALRFSAVLRLPPGTSSETIDSLVEHTLDDLGLQQCSNTMIGGAMIKGISGGQRKRTSVGVEVITQPSLLFLDEPTSGLDSYSAFNCVQLLKKLATENTTILCTIHQPASEVFSLFDRCIMMKSGRIFYQGPTSHMVSHFSSLGFSCPYNYNPSDFIMQLSQTQSMEECEKKGLFMDQPSDFQHEGPPAGISVVDTLFCLPGGEKEAEEAKAGEPMTKSASFVAPVRAGTFTQLVALTLRELTNLVRDKGALIGRFGVTIFLNLLFGLIFLNAGNQDDNDRTNFNSHFGALTMVFIASMFGSAQPVMLLFPFERPMFMREYSTGTYTAINYFISKTFIELPLTLAQSCAQWLLCYFLCGFRGNAGYFILASWGVGAASASCATCLGCAVPDVKSVQELAPLLFVPQLLFAGFFIQTDKIPVWLRWAQWLCGIKYGMNLALLNEFNKFLPSCQGAVSSIYCNQILSQNSIKDDDWPLYIGILVALFFGFRILAALILTQKAKKFY